MDLESGTNGQFTIRKASEADFPFVAKLFADHNHGLKKEEWLRWKYTNHPDGSCRMYVAVDSSGAIVGFMGFIPRRILHGNGAVLPVMHSVDAFVAAELRKHGIYSMLTRHTMANFLVPKISFPNKLSVNFSIKDRFRSAGPFEEWVFPIAISPVVRKAGFSPLGSVANQISRFYSLLVLGKSPGQIQMREVQRFERDFRLETVCMHGERSAAYLNWRFIDNPMRRFSAFEFFEGSKCLGYCIYTIEGSAAKLYDFVVVRRRRSCLRLLVEHCRKQQLSHLSFKGVGLRLKRYGFLVRRLQDRFAVLDVPEGPWMITLCDKDV